MLEFINKRKLCLGLFIIFFLIMHSACSNTEIGNPDSSSLFSMKNDAELETYLQTQYLSDFRSEQSGDAAEIVKNPLLPDESSDAAFADVIISISSGMYKYEAYGSMIKVSRVENNDKLVEKIAEIETFGMVIKLLINQNILIVIQTNTGSVNTGGFNSNIQTGVLFIDISNPSIPERLMAIQIDGRFIENQNIDNILKNDKLYVIQQFQAEIDLQTDQQIENFSIDRLIPYYAYIDDLGQPLGFSRLVEPDDLFRPAVPSGSSMTIVTILNVKDMFMLPQSTGFIGNIENVSSNSTAIYLNESTGTVYEINITGEKPVFIDFDSEI